MTVDEAIKETLRLAVDDIPHCCHTCLNLGLNPDNEKFCTLVNVVNPQYGGTAQWGKCKWQWQHTDKMKGLIEL